IVLVDDDARGIAAVGRLARTALDAVVGGGHAVDAILLLAFAAGRTLAAGIDEAADTDRIAHLETRHRAADRAHVTDDLVAGHHREDAATPCAACLVDVRMADPAVADLDLYIVRTRRAAFNRPR